MIYIMKNGGHDTYNIKQFTLDTPDDLPNLPTSGIAVGSAALVISTSDVYMLNSKGKWDLIASDAEGVLPPYDAEDAGKILEVGDGGVLTWAANEALPSVTSEDEGKVLKVDDQGEWVAAVDSNTQYTAGANISIDANNEISAVDTTYSAGANVSISNENVISATDTKYTAGSGIEISDQNVISNTAEGNTDIIAEEFDSTKAYAVGDYCIYNNKLYRCTTAIAASNWLKAPQTLGTFAVTVNSENTDDTYFTQTKNGKWIVISETIGQAINLNRSINLTTAYASGNYYYNSTDYYYPALLPYFNGGYTNESEALTDFSNHSSFDSSKWTEVTVGDELKSIKGDIPTYTAGTNVQISSQNIISATDTTYSAGSGISIDSNNEISADSQLPTVTSVDEGKVLAVDDQGTWTAQEQEIITAKSLSGDLVSFNDGADAPLVDCKVHIEAVQSGSGDPSPDNIRPISGFNAVNVGDISDTEKVQYFKGLLDGTYGFVDLGTLTWNYERAYNRHGFAFSELTLTPKVPESNAMPNAICSNYNMNTSTNGWNNRQTVTQMCFDLLYARIYNDGDADGATYKAAMNGVYLIYELATPTTTTITPTEFNTLVSAFGLQGWLVQINWQSTAGTVYGGTLDVKTGVLIGTHGIIEFDGSNNEDWAAQNNCFTIGVIGIKKVLTTGATNIIICNSYKSAGVRFRSDCPEYGCIKTVGDTIQIAFKNTAITDYTTWRQTLSANPITVVYELATPVTYQLTPTEIRSLLGVNNVWADCGAIDLTYFVQGTQPIIDYIDNSKELPSVSSADEGKVLTVDASGNWVASTIPDGSDTNY